MKKAVADLAPTLPVKVIGFSCKSAFYADFSHDMYVSGGCRPKASDPGVSISRKSTQEGAAVTCASGFQDYDLPASTHHLAENDCIC
jgi:hypothetical protein